MHTVALIVHAHSLTPALIGVETTFSRDRAAFKTSTDSSVYRTAALDVKPSKDV